jgi:hypothetical protein
MNITKTIVSIYTTEAGSRYKLYTDRKITGRPPLLQPT